MKSVYIRSHSGSYSVRMRENTDQNNSEYGHFLCSDFFTKKMADVIDGKKILISTNFKTCFPCEWSLSAFLNGNRCLYKNFPIIPLYHWYLSIPLKPSESQWFSGSIKKVEAWNRLKYPSKPGGKYMFKVNHVQTH